MIARPRQLEEARRRRCGLTVAHPQYRQHIPTPLITTIVSTVASEFRVSPSDLTSPSRQAHLVDARQIAYQLAYERGAGESAIGRVFRRDHSTVKHALTRFEAQERPEQLEVLQSCRRSVRASLAAQKGAGA